MFAVIPFKEFSTYFACILYRAKTFRKVRSILQCLKMTLRMFTSECAEKLRNTDDKWNLPSSPPPPEKNTGPRVRHIKYDEAPEPIGGFAAIQRTVVYLEIAQEAGVEGTVVVQGYVNKEGIVTETVVLKGINDELNNAAMEAVRKTKFKPAVQRDRPVGVYISIPIIFKLQKK